MSDNQPDTYWSDEELSPDSKATIYQKIAEAFLNREFLQEACEAYWKDNPPKPKKQETWRDRPPLF